MKIYLAVLFFLTTMCFSVQAQTAKPTPPKIIEQPVTEICSAKKSDLPTVRGLRLEMSKQQVLREYPLMTVSSDPVNSSGIILGSKILNPEYNSNLDRVTVVFKNDKVFSVLYTYSPALKWESAREFADKISATLKLPKARERKNAGGIYYSLTCADFLVRTRINGDNQGIFLLSKEPDEPWESTQQKKETFKP